MKPEFRTTRRRVLQLIATGLGAASVPVSVKGASLASSGSDPVFARTLDALISDKESAAVIGAAYLDQFELERSSAILQTRIQESMSDAGLTMGEHALLRRVEMDFERGEIVNLHGWLLSRTEARLCALCVPRR